MIKPSEVIADENHFENPVGSSYLCLMVDGFGLQDMHSMYSMGHRDRYVSVGRFRGDAVSNGQYQERADRAGGYVPDKPIWFTYAGRLVVGPCTAASLCDSGSCLWIRHDTITIAFKEKGGDRVSKSNKICPACGRKMKQQFIGLQHCKCGMSWEKDRGFFERSPDMVFALERRSAEKKAKRSPVIRRSK